jgi:hypothetical protein
MRTHRENETLFAVARMKRSAIRGGIKGGIAQPGLRFASSGLHREAAPALRLDSGLTIGSVSSTLDPSEFSAEPPDQ